MRVIIDVDDTISVTDFSVPYSRRKPKTDVIKKLQEYKEKGFEIVIHTGRQMKTYEGNVGKINIFTLPTLLAWLKKHKVPFDEVYIGRPWCGAEGFYVCDATVRPDEFVTLTYEEIMKKLKECRDK